MDLVLEDSSVGNRVSGYTDDSVTVNGEKFYNSLILHSSRELLMWRPQAVEEIAAEDIAELIKGGPEVILLGTGANMQLIDDHILSVAWQQQIGVEIMPTGAACRTYNIMIADLREVVAGLII